MIDKVDSLGNELSKEQQEFFKDSKVVKGNKLLVCYHGTGSNFRTFKNAINWFSIDKNYTTQFANFRSNNNQVTYEVYLNCKHLFNCGDTNGRVYGLIPTIEDFQPNMKRIFDGLGLNENECKEFIKKVIEERDKEGYIDDSISCYKYKLKVHIVTRTKVFRDLVKSKGYDGVITREENGSVCFGVFDPSDIKLVSNKKPTLSPNIDEVLNKRGAKLNDREALKVLSSVDEL